MSRPRHYVPCIRRSIVGALYHEAKARRKPMTRLVNDLLTDALKGTPGWHVAHTALAAAQGNQTSSSDHLTSVR